MKPAITFIRSLFKKRKSLSSVISEAMSEGIRDTLKEMGYRFDDNDKQKQKFKKVE